MRSHLPEDDPAGCAFALLLALSLDAMIVLVVWQLWKFL